MRFLSNWFKPRSTPRSSRSFRPTLDHLEARQLLSSTPVTPPTGLHDALIAPVAQAEFIRDQGHLSRADVINLFDVVDGTEAAVFSNNQLSFTAATPVSQATLKQSQLTDLRTLVRDATAWGLSADVANLADKLVNQNAANEHYQGAPLLPSGQLTAGTSDTDVQDLVGKWFYGTDLPDVSEAAVNNGIPDNVVYQQAQGVLFGSSGPKATDVAQGWDGDCYFMSSLGETAQQAPGTIKSMFIDNGDGTYTVRFYELKASDNTWHADYVTVNLQLPVLQQSGQFAFAGWYQGGQPTTYTDPNAVLWPSLAEKAYAQLAEEGWSRGQYPSGSANSGTPSDWNQNSYDALAYGDGVAMQQITGASISSDLYLPTATTTDEANLEQAFKHGSLVIFGSPAQMPANVPTDAAGAPLIISGHVYALKTVDVADDKFTLINPYDDHNPYPGDGQRSVTLTWPQLQLYLNDAFVLAPPPIDPAHAVIQQGSATGLNGNAQAAGIEWYVNGKHVSSLSAVRPGDTVTVTFHTAAGINPTDFSLVSYAAPNSNFTSGNIDHQQVWADSTVTATGAGSYSLTVIIPNGDFQLDFVRGDAIADFATGERYHSDGRFIDGVQGS